MNMRFLFIILCWISIYVASFENELDHVLSEPYPTPFTKHNKIYAQILAFNFYRIDPILIILSEYKAMCEGGWEPHIQFITTVNVTDIFMRFLATKTYCYRIEASLNITMHVTHDSVNHNKISGLLLADASRSLLSQALPYHNIFIYQEDDIMLQFSHVSAYLHETKKLMELIKNANVSSVIEKKKYFGLHHYCFGFQRYRRKLKTYENRNVPMSDNDMIHQELLDEVPLFKPICILDKPYIKVTSNSNNAMTNPHQAMFILTRQQILILEDKCKFLTQSIKNDELKAYTREYMSSLSIFENHIVSTNCGMEKLLPAEHFSNFGIIHYYGSENHMFEINNHPVFTVDEHIKAGLIQFESPLSYAGYYNDVKCWEPLLHKYRLIQNVTYLETEPVLFKIGREIFLLEKGVKRSIWSMDVFNKRGYKLENVHVIDHPAILHALPDGEEEHSSTIITEEAIAANNQHLCKLVPLPANLQSNLSVPYSEFTTEYTTLRKTLLHYHSGIDRDSDVISGQYEGGYKVWECSIDLVNYMYEQCKQDTLLSRTIPNSRVLELGCGHGFPGIVAINLGCQSVVFSDLNEEVLVESTWPNICVNCPQHVNKVECYSGDWLSLSEHLNQYDGMFDLILSAETLYTIESCQKMFYMIKTHLSRNGIALIASKRFYFGVGGGTMELSNLVETNINSHSSCRSGQLSFEVVKEFMDGSSNIREIVMLKWK